MKIELRNVNGEVETREIRMTEEAFKYMKMPTDAFHECVFNRNRDGSMSLIVFSFGADEMIELYRVYPDSIQYFARFDSFEWKCKPNYHFSKQKIAEYMAKSFIGGSKGFNKPHFLHMTSDAMDLLDRSRRYEGDQIIPFDSADAILPPCKMPLPSGDGLKHEAYLQRVAEDIVVIRIFASPYAYGYDPNNDSIPVMEHSRIFIKDGKKPEFRYVTANGWKEDNFHNIRVEDLSFHVYGHDDLSGHSIMYHCDETDSQKMMLSIMFRGMENCFKSKGDMDIFMRLLQTHRDCSFEWVCEYYFGYFDADANSFSRMIGVPQSYVPAIAGFVRDIYETKGPFHYIGAFANSMKFVREYGDMTASADIFLRNLSAVFFFSEKDVFGRDLMERLEDLFGYGICKSLNSFSQYFSKIADEQRKLYLDYIRMIARVDMEGYGFRWNPQNIQREHDNASEILNLISDKDDVERYGKRFSELSQAWKHLEYHEDTLSVITPSSAMDIIKEGRALNHCVRSYLNEICRGRTTIAFIRKNSDVEKPFYTMEIKDGKIAQCRGFDNSDPAGDVRSFIERYCEDKCLGMLNGRNKAVGA